MRWTLGPLLTKLACFSWHQHDWQDMLLARMRIAMCGKSEARNKNDVLRKRVVFPIGFTSFPDGYACKARRRFLYFSGSPARFAAQCAVWSKRRGRTKQCVGLPSSRSINKLQQPGFDYSEELFEPRVRPLKPWRALLCLALVAHRSPIGNGGALTLSGRLDIPAALRDLQSTSYTISELR